jgi:hypothetical protein
MAKKTDLSIEDAQKEFVAAIDKATTVKITLERQADNVKWTITVLPD